MDNLNTEKILTVIDLRNEKIIAMTLQGYSKRRIAQELNISQEAVSAFLITKPAQSAIREACESVQQAAQVMLPKLFMKSLQALEEVLDGYSSKAELIAASKAVQQIAFNLAKLDIEATKAGIGKIVAQNCPTHLEDDGSNTTA